MEEEKISDKVVANENDFIQTEVKNSDDATELLNTEAKKNADEGEDQLSKDLDLKSTIGRTGLPNV